MNVRQLFLTSVTYKAYTSGPCCLKVGYYYPQDKSLNGG